jgi:hypothetical protein
MVTESQKDYSDYIQHASNTNSMLSLLSGFTFTAFTILLAQLPDPSSILSQITLFFIAALFYVFLTELGWMHMQTIRLYSNVPPASRGLNTFNFVNSLSYTGLELTVVLMLLIWNLNYLALATGIMWVILAIFNIGIVRVFLEYRKTIK